ncbi:MAG: hypothetical protein U5K54_13875 [Cytophagales bacterium]|nr:hypothetical protein [Cytophagales bacterium]
MKKYFLLLILFYFYQMGTAQILRVDKGDLLLDSSRLLIGNVGLSFDINNRSATSEEEITFVGFKTTADLVYLSDKHAYVSVNNIQYFKSTGGPLSSNGYSHFRINFMRRKLLSYETYAQLQYDDGRNMPGRFLFGGGLRLRLHESKRIGFHAGVGVMNEVETWNDLSQDGSTIRKQIIKTSDYLGFTAQLNDFVSTQLTVYYQGGFDQEDDLFRSQGSAPDFLFNVKVTDKDFVCYFF